MDFIYYLKGEGKIMSEMRNGSFRTGFFGQSRFKSMHLVIFILRSDTGPYVSMYRTQCFHVTSMLNFF